MRWAMIRRDSQTMNGYPIEDSELLPDSPSALKATYHDLALALRRIKELEAENAALRAPIRSSLEVLQRMANGLDPFDKGRFAAAVAALPHETPKLRATINHNFGHKGIGERLDEARR